MATFRIFGGGQLIGSIGGTVYQRGRFGAVARNRTVPVNPNTARQVRARAAMAWASNEWLNMSPTQRAGWESYAEVTAWLNRLGDTSYLTGKMQFMRRATFEYNMCAVLGVPIAITLDPPTAPGLPPIPTAVLSAYADTGDISMESTNITPIAGEIVEVLYTINLNPLKNFYKGPFQYTYFNVGAFTPPTVILAGGTLMTAFQVVARIRWQDQYGRLSQSDISRTSIIATTPP